MIFVGERINGGFKDIQRAVKEKNKSTIQRWAKIQSEAGADYLDVNIGAASNKVDDFIWMIEAVQEAVETPVSIDSNKPAFVEKARPDGFGHRDDQKRHQEGQARPGQDVPPPIAHVMRMSAGAGATGRCRRLSYRTCRGRNASTRW